MTRPLQNIKIQAQDISIQLDSVDKKHIQKCTRNLSGTANKIVMEKYYALYGNQGRREANLFLLKLDNGSNKKARFSTSYEKHAFECQETIQVMGIAGGIQLFKDRGLTLPKGETEESTIARMVDADVWARKLKTKHNQTNENSFIHVGHICKGRQVYVSNWWLARFIEQQKDSASFMARKIAVSSEGDELSLAEVSASTVANPINRRHEMNVRMRGFEDTAKALEEISEGEKLSESAGFVCDFYTLTTPSKYHRKKRVGAEKYMDEMGKIRYKNGYFINNKKYQPVLEIKNKDGLVERINNSPKVAQAYLVKVFSRIRAKLKREGIETFGYRVVEPHHDGTPHWHLAFFMRPEDKEKVRAIFHHYALQEDGSEAGALKHRFVPVSHDPKKGSITGYMTKYISKNIAGFGIGEDFESGLDCDDVVLRVLAWKSLWGIRQFSFYGSPSVSVWRELRKLRDPLTNPTAEKARLAADGGHWDLYIKIMSEHKIKLVKTPVLDDEGQDKKNKYGEVIMRIKGLEVSNLTGSELIKTRLKEWFLIDMDKLEERIIKGLPFIDRENSIYIKDIQNLVQRAKDEKKVTRLHQATNGLIPFSSGIFSSGREVSTPWSSVNNCTEKIKDPKIENNNQEALSERN